MNDPGLDEPIKESLQTEHDRTAEKDVEKEDEQTFLNPRFEAPPTSSNNLQCPVDGGSPQPRFPYLPLVATTCLEVSIWLRGKVGHVRTNGQCIQHLRSH